MIAMATLETMGMVWKKGFMWSRKPDSTAGMKSTSRHQAGIGGMTHLACEKVAISNFKDTFQHFMPPFDFQATMQL